MNTLRVLHAGQLVTLAGPGRARRGAEMERLEIIDDGAMLIRDGLIAWVGVSQDIPDSDGPAVNLNGRVVLPGFVDSHTHAVYVRPRLDEFEWRARGASYMEILEKGGGIHSSVRAVRQAEALGIQHEEKFLECGTTSLEIKSGYGLRLADELRMLEAATSERLRVFRTYLGAHALPPEFATRRNVFVDQVISDIDTIADQSAAEFCDVFCEPGAFTVDEARRIFQKALERGLRIKMHADEFDWSGGAELAAELGALSADHLGAISPAGIDAIARSGVVACLLPATLFMLGVNRYAPARTLIQNGAAVALASDFNPGSSPTLSMPFVWSLACTQMKMTPAEALTALTINGAAAVGRAATLGSLEPGKCADFAVYDAVDYRELPYHAGMNFCRAAFVNGRQMSGEVIA